MYWRLDKTDMSTWINHNITGWTLIYGCWTMVIEYDIMIIHLSIKCFVFVCVNRLVLKLIDL